MDGAVTTNYQLVLGLLLIRALHLQVVVNHSLRPFGHRLRRIFPTRIGRGSERSAGRSLPKLLFQSYPV